METQMTANNALRATDISWEKKLAHLRELSEEDFRDNVVRTVFERQGLKHLRRTHGPDEEGKDAIFEGTDSLKRRLIYAIQTKKGNINKASKAADNLLTATTQLRTTIESDIYLTATKQRVRADCVILCASVVAVGNRSRGQLSMKMAIATATIIAGTRNANASPRVSAISRATEGRGCRDRR